MTSVADIRELIWQYLLDEGVLFYEERNPDHEGAVGIEGWVDLDDLARKIVQVIT